MHRQAGKTLNSTLTHRIISNNSSSLTYATSQAYSTASTSKDAPKDQQTPNPEEQTPGSKPPPKKKSTLQLDEELSQKMSGLSGDGGAAGIEYENGEPVAMKRSVKNNMFRYI